MGQLYHFGDFLKQDDEKAYKWFKASAEQGNDYGQWDLANCYYFGAGVEQDYEEAFKWYEMSAAQGNLDAYYSLGVCYGYGDCADLDYTESANWFLRAAQEGHADSQYNIGFIYLEGIGVKQDKNEAVKWIRKAADQGQEDAVAMLHVILDEGLTVPGKLYSFDENSHYEISSTKKYKTIADSDNSYGTFVVIGKIGEQNHRDGVPSFDVTAGQIDIHYRYLDDYLVAFNNDWHFIRDDSRIVDNLTLSEDIRKGALILQTSKDHSSWTTVFEKSDMFQKDPIQVGAFYTPTDDELSGGCFYRAIIVYEIQRKNGSENETVKNAEVYEFYLCDPTLNSVKPESSSGKADAVDTIIDASEKTSQTKTEEPTHTPEPTNTPAPTLTPTKIRPTNTPAKEVAQTYYFDSKVIPVKKDSGYSVEEDWNKNNPHYGWDIGKFMVTGFTSYVDSNGELVFLKNVGDEITFSFRLGQNISKLNGNDSLIIDEDSNGYDKYFNIQPTNFGKGALFIRQKDYQNKYTTTPYMNFLEAKGSLRADTDVKMLEEGDYEVGLDYSIKKKQLFPEITDYRIFFTFKIRNGNCMVYLFDTATGGELTNQAYTENGFTINLAKSRYLDIKVERSILNDSANGLARDTRFNKSAKDNERFTDEGIYTITVSNRYTGATTEKIIYVGTDPILKAYAVTNLPIQEIRQMLENGAKIQEDGYIFTATPTLTPTATFTPEPTNTSEPTATFTTVVESISQPTETPVAIIEPSTGENDDNGNSISPKIQEESFIQKNQSALIIGGTIFVVFIAWFIITHKRGKKTEQQQVQYATQVLQNVNNNKSDSVINEKNVSKIDSGIQNLAGESIDSESTTNTDLDSDQK